MNSSRSAQATSPCCHTAKANPATEAHSATKAHPATKVPLPLANAHSQGLHSIGDAAKLTGISAKMIRHYESLGLIAPSARSEGNYRLFQAQDLEQLGFIRNARALGFSIKQISTLLELWQNRARNSREVKQLALAHLHDITERIHALEQMRELLEGLADRCQGDHSPDCPILEGLACEKIP